MDRYAHLQFALREEIKRSGIPCTIEPVKTKGKAKEGRIRQRLAPLFENGIIYTKRHMKELESELFTFPNGTHDDLIDALAWQVEGIATTDPIPVAKMGKGRMLPTLGEMMGTITRRKLGNYPFQVQCGERVGIFNN